MATITIPKPNPKAEKYEVRADGLHFGNNLDVQLPSDPALITDQMLIAKYGSVIIDRQLEPQDAAGKKVGNRTRADSAHPSMADILTRTYQRPDGSTFTGRQHCWDLQIMADHHKAEGLLPAAPAPEKP